MRTAFMLAIAGLAAGSFAQTADPKGMPSDQVGYIYFNATTGEMVRTGPGSPRDQNQPLWVNEQYDQCGYAEWQYLPVRDSANQQDDWVLDWGDVRHDSVVNCMTFLYSTSVPDPELDGVDGYEMDVSFFDGVDTPEIAAGLEPYLIYTVTGFPGVGSVVTGWLITVDISGGGEFEIGDENGIDDSGNGFNSGGLGADLDGDGLSDFAIGFNFRHPDGLSAGMTGLGLAGPSDSATGDVDQMALFQHQDWSVFDGFFDLGGYDCSGGEGFAWTPWASIYIGLYEDPALGCYSCPPDLNADCRLDFFDLQLYLNWFAAGDLRADFAPPQGTLDFFDIQEFLSQFTIGCP